MKSKKLFIVLFFFLQFFLVVFTHFTQIRFFLLTEVFFGYLLIDIPFPFLSILLYFPLFPSETFISLCFIYSFHFLKEKVKIPITISIVLFLILYFFTARYENGVIQIIMPGFMAFVSIVFAITRIPDLTVSVSKSVFVYAICGLVYGFLYETLSFFNSKPFLMFAVDIIQIVVAFVLYTSFEIISIEKPENTN